MDSSNGCSRKEPNLFGEIVQYEDVYRLCYIRGVEGILIGLAEQLGSRIATDVIS